MKDNRIKGARWAILIIWLIFIFVMSQQPGDTSGEQSKLVLSLFYMLGIDLNSVFGDLANFIVRKGAHFSEYFILYILFYRVFIIYYDKSKSLILSISSVFFYACTDEFHQSFVDGRVAAFTDVLIDTLGGIFSAVIYSLIEKIKKVKFIDINRVDPKSRIE